MCKYVYIHRQSFSYSVYIYIHYIIYRYTSFFKVTLFGPISDKGLSDLHLENQKVTLKKQVQIYYVVVSDIFDLHPKIGEDVLPF